MLICCKEKLCTRIRIVSTENRVFSKYLTMVFRFVIHKECHWVIYQIRTSKLVSLCWYLFLNTTTKFKASKAHLRLLSTPSLVWTKSLALAFINFSVTFANKGLFPVSKRDVETLFGFFPAKLNVHAVELLYLASSITL